jgi:hypothetical protein
MAEAFDAWPSATSLKTDGEIDAAVDALRARVDAALGDPVPADPEAPAVRGSALLV